MIEKVYNLGVQELFPIYQISSGALSLYLFFTLAFFAYYFWRYLKHGIFTFDTFAITLTLYIPIVFMFPFTFSKANGFVATGEFHEVYLPYLEKAFYICAVGITSFVVGGTVATFSRFRLPGHRLVIHSLRNFWMTRVGIFAMTGLILVLLTLMVGLGFELGNARGTAMIQPLLRPIYNLFHVLVPFTALNTLVYAYRRSSQFFYFWSLLLITAGLVSGTRAASIGILISFAAILVISTRYRNLFLVALASLLLIGSAMYIGGFRYGEYGLTMVWRTPLLLLYGNNFSDLRDFAWVLSGWDKNFLYGKTQLAGFLSFIPSSLSEFRTVWGWGNFSTTSAGISSIIEHPGLRTTNFGETYFNYGLPGVVTAGFLYGFVVFKLTKYTSLAVKSSSPKGVAIQIFGAFIYLDLFRVFLNTAGFFSFYIILTTIIAGEVVFRGVQFSKRVTANA